MNAQTQDTNFLSDQFSLAGKVAVVIGGGGVLGGAIAHGLGRAGARIALVGRTEKKLLDQAALFAADGVESITAQADALKIEEVRACLARIERELGEVDILVNAAGGNVKEATVSPQTDFFNLPFDALKQVMDINVLAGAILPCQVFGEKMARRDAPTSIINVTSMAAERPLTRVVGYAAAKAAVTNFTRWLAVHMALDLKSRVRVNAISPGFFLTEQNRFLLTKEGGGLTPRGETIIAHSPAARFGRPDELIGAAIWLASDASSFVTGAIIPVDGGFSAFSGV